MNVARQFGLSIGDEVAPSVKTAVIEQVRDSADRHLGISLRDVQIAAGQQLLRRCIVEMETGEGKTLTTVIPCGVLAKSGKKVLVATANDYLADRDAGWMKPLYNDLGLSVGRVTSQCNTQQRRNAYSADVTYGTLREFGFDHLRDRLDQRSADGPSEKLARNDHAPDALVVDEADSVLIDEARTPMVITAPTSSIDAPTEACYRWCAQVAGSFRTPEDFLTVESDMIALTDRGRRRFLKMKMPDEMAPLTTTDILHALERAIWVNQVIDRDVHYLIRDDRIELIDEYTGRAAKSRVLGGGLHQAIEAREELPLTSPSLPAARITVQDFVSRFQHLCGITATAWEQRREFGDVYGLAVQRIGPHVPSRRHIETPVACRTIAEKYRRIADEVQNLIRQDRAVLIGTRDIMRSEQLSDVLKSQAIDHVVLSARHPKQEADIVAGAGRPGQVTVATNMAGRGTDIALDPQVASAGGLHVIVSEPHAAARIDRQLIGRGARQGDPGSARCYASLEDEIIDQAFSPDRAQKIRLADTGKLLSFVRTAQRIVTRNHRQQRKRLTAQEAKLQESLRTLGLDPHLDCLP